MMDDAITQVDALLKRADDAINLAKPSGRIRVYGPALPIAETS